MSAEDEARLMELADNRLMPDDARPNVTLREIRALIAAVRTEEGGTLTECPLDGVHELSEKP